MRPIALASILALTVPAFGQTVLLREGDPSPDGTSGQTITALSNTAVNQNGGYACTLNTGGAAGTVSTIWGNLAGGPGAVIRQETTIGTLTQTSFESFFGISQTAVSYSPSCNDAGGSTSLDGVWLDSAIVAIEEQSVPGTSDFWSFASRPGATQSGVPYFVGGFTDTAGGSTMNRGLFFGATPTAIYMGGMMVPNLPAPLTTSGPVDFDFRFSANGTHHIALLDSDTGSTANDGVVAIDGAGLILDGTLVQEDNLVPASILSTGEAWDNFDFFGINEAGDYMFTGDVTGATATDEFILRNGAIWAREGDMLDGEVLTGAIEAAFLNENGQMAFVWDVVDGTGNVEALYFEDQLVLREGDPVDWDGDGMPDAGTALTNFTGISSLTLGPDGTMYFTADVDVSGTVLEGYFAVEAPGIGTNYCMANPNSTGVPSSISASGSASLAANDLTLICTDMPLNAFAIFITGQTQGFVGNSGGSSGNLCITDPVGRAVGGAVLFSGGTGAVSVAVDWTNLPQPNGPVAAMVGDTWNFQCWNRDTDGMGGLTSNFSDGLEVLVQ